jgi:CheY-like chemotaxis protein/HPt (histidine-containing phosphotransfer) domain-containing protein
MLKKSCSLVEEAQSQGAGGLQEDNFSLRREGHERNPEERPAYEMDAGFWSADVPIHQPEDKSVAVAKRRAPSPVTATTARTGVLHFPRKFCATAPPDSLAAPPSAVPPLAHPAAPAVALRVLVVDDVAMNRDIAGCFLQAAGHNATCVEGGAEAIAVVKTADFDVVLMDVRMPEMDGLEATRRIRALNGARALVPIVALTARAFAEQVAECRDAGMDGHVVKPFTPDTLLSAVLQAFAAGPSRGETPIPESPMAPAPSRSAFPPIGSERLVLDQTVFERTAFFLQPDTVNSYVRSIAERAEALLRRLRGSAAPLRSDDELAEAAHTIAGSAGMLGFERLTYVGRRFERAIESGAADTAALGDGLCAALEATIDVINKRSSVLVKA